MRTKITQAELEFMEHYFTPYELIECLIPENFDAPHTWGLESNQFKIRNYQFPMISYEMMYADEPNLTARQNFKRKKGAGDIYNISGRNEGKSLVGMDLDAVVSTCYYFDGENALASFDDYHLNERTERVANLIEGHNFFQIFHLDGQKKTINRGNKFSIRCSSGYKLLGINENVSGKIPGKQFHGKHYRKLWYDEASYHTEEGLKKRVDSGHSDGYIERFFGIPDLQPGSPMGKILIDPKKRNWICRLPQMVREDWDISAENEAVEKYGGKDSLGFRLNVLAELIEGAFGRFDMKRIQSKCHNIEKDIKHFEVGKTDFEDYEDILEPIEKVPCKQVFICSDIGTTGSPSEIIIIFGSDGKYKYRYNVTLNRLITQEQAKVFKYLFDKFGDAFISLDCTSDGGRAIADELEILGVPKKNIIRCSFNAKIKVGLEIDKENKAKLDDKGNPIEKFEMQIDWSCQRLDHLFYNGLIEIPNDNKFFKQFTAYICKTIGSRNTYGSVLGADHLVQSFQCFALAHFIKEYDNSKTDEESTYLGSF